MEARVSMPVKRLIERTFCILRGRCGKLRVHKLTGEAVYNLRRTVWVESFCQMLDLVWQKRMGRILGSDTNDGEAQLSEFVRCLHGRGFVVLIWFSFDKAAPGTQTDGDTLYSAVQAVLAWSKYQSRVVGIESLSMPQIGNIWCALPQYKTRVVQEMAIVES